MPQTPGLIIAAASSNSGKTMVTLGLATALRHRDLRVISAKVGPDYIDPAFHAAATNQPCLNLDPWAMQSNSLMRHLTNLSQNSDLLLVEGVMGLFDGAADGTGSTADIAMATGLPIVLVLDGKGMGASIAAIARGFRDHNKNVHIAGLLINRVSGDRHRSIISAALKSIGIPILGYLPYDARMVKPSRHLGLVQAIEDPTLLSFLETAGDWIAKNVDLEAFIKLALPTKIAATASPLLPPLGQRIAIARDVAFAFAYPHMLADWRAAGAELTFFSPLANEAPDRMADAIYLPGGYPELYAAPLSTAENYLAGLRKAAKQGISIYGECGGYMALGRALIDADGKAHAMANLLPVVTSFEKRKLHLGYRQICQLVDLSFSRKGALWRGHEFHYASQIEGDAKARSLFSAKDALGDELGVYGMQVGVVSGSYLHLIDKVSS